MSSPARSASEIARSRATTIETNSPAPPRMAPKAAIAALEEALQLAKAGELGGRAHHFERHADEALAAELVERLTEQGDEIDLALAVLSAADLTIGRAICRDGDCRRVRAERLDHGPVQAFRQNVELHGMRDSRKTGFGQNLRHHGNDSPHLLDMAAQVLGSVEIDEKEFRGVVKARTLQKVLMRTRKTRRLPAAQERPPFAEGSRPQRSGRATTPSGRARRAAGRERLPSTYQNFITPEPWVGPPKRAETAFCPCRNALWWGKAWGVKNEPQRAHVAGRHVVAAHGPAAQPDDDRHGLDTGRPGRARQAREAARREAPHLSALSPEGRVRAGRTLLASTTRISTSPTT